MINSEGTPAKGLSPGKRLLQGRLQLGLTQEQVAKELYITLVKIKALEADDFGRLNADTFIRGYIRSYANLLKLDVVEILAAYDQLLQERNNLLAATPEARVEAAIAARANKGTLPFLMVLGALLLGLWLISVWFFNNQPAKNYSTLVVNTESLSSSSLSNSLADAEEGATDDAANTPTQSQLSYLATASSSANTATSASINATNKVVAGGAAADKVNALNSQAVKGHASVSSVASASNSSVVMSSASERSEPTKKSNALDTIVFNFRAECWLEVSDSRGDVLATELQAAGSKMTLVGKAPFDVKLGNAPAVDIQLNGKKIDVILLLGSNVLTLRVKN